MDVEKYRADMFFEFRYSLMIFISFFSKHSVLRDSALIFQDFNPRLPPAPNPWANRLVNSGEEEELSQNSVCEAKAAGR